MQSVNRLAVAVAAVSLCSGCSRLVSPTAPSGSGSNVSPVLTSVSVTPSFGVSGLSTFTANAYATDANNDPLTYTWTFGSSSLAGASVSGTITGDGSVPVKVTVTDGKGGSATDTRSVTIGSLSGIWDVVVPSTCGADGYSATLTQSTAGRVSGSFFFTRQWCNVPAGTTGFTDPAEPGTISATGAVTIRMKIGYFTDSLMRGTMGTSGRVITGGIFNSGWSGQYFVANKR